MAAWHDAPAMTVPRFDRFDRRADLSRWSIAALAVVAAHAALVSALAIHYVRLPPEQPIIPAIIVSLEPAAPSSP